MVYIEFTEYETGIVVRVGPFEEVFLSDDNLDMKDSDGKFIGGYNPSEELYYVEGIKNRRFDRVRIIAR